MSTYIYPTFDQPKKIIDLNDISQSYNNGKTYVLKDLNFAVTENPGKGRFIGLLGASGSGKSTLLRYIAGLQSPTSGKVLINGKPPGNDNRVSVVFQEYSSMPWKKSKLSSKHFNSVDDRTSFCIQNAYPYFLCNTTIQR